MPLHCLLQPACRPEEPRRPRYIPTPVSCRLSGPRGGKSHISGRPAGADGHRPVIKLGRGRAHNRKTRNSRNATMSSESSDSGGRPFGAPFYVEKVGVYGLYVPPKHTRGRPDRIPWTTRTPIRACLNSKFRNLQTGPRSWHSRAPLGLAGRRPAALPGSEGPVKPFRAPPRDAIPRSCAVPSLFLAGKHGTKAGKRATLL